MKKIILTAVIIALTSCEQKKQLDFNTPKEDLPTITDDSILLQKEFENIPEELLNIELPIQENTLQTSN